MKITPLKEVVREARKRAVMNAMRQCGGNVSKAARELQIARSYLYRLIKDM